VTIPPHTYLSHSFSKVLKKERERERELGVKLCWKQDGNWAAARDFVTHFLRFS